MSDNDHPNDPGDISMGHQPKDVEEMRYGKGPGESEMQVPDFSGGHPKGLWVLFITEMWERFSYYGMRALLVLFLVSSTAEFVGGEANSNPGFGWSDADAVTLYGVYIFMVYLTSIFGGFIADRLLGTHKSMIVGGWAIAFGHIALALTALFSFERGAAVSAGNGIGALTMFLFGLSLIIIGTGFFKPCVSVMVGQLYGKDDPRRDSGFTIYYMGINLGAFLSPLVAGTLGEKVGWHWGFGSAAVGMLFCLFCYQMLRPMYMKGIGNKPEKGISGKDRPLIACAIVGLLGIPLLPMALYLLGWLGPFVNAWSWLSGSLKWYGMAAVIAFLLIGSIVAFLSFQKKNERAPLAVIFVLAFIGNIGFWTAFEQAGSSMTLFAERNTDRSFPIPEFTREFLRSPGFGSLILSFLIGALLFTPLIARMKGKLSSKLIVGYVVWIVATLGLGMCGIGITKTIDIIFGTKFIHYLADMQEFPTTWFQSINALAIIFFAPFFSWLWLYLGRRKLEPSTPMKFSLGLWILGLSFLAMVVGAWKARNGDPTGPQWLAITFVVYTWGELCLSPVGLSMVTKLAPERLQSLMMGLWWFTFAVSNLLSGLVARLSTQFVPQNGEPAQMSFIIDGLAGFFLMMVIFPIGIGILIALMVPMLKKMMKGEH
jgi:proton-dependent oligopeptide transporter, POT family